MIPPRSTNSPLVLFGIMRCAGDVLGTQVNCALWIVGTPGCSHSSPLDSFTRNILVHQNETFCNSRLNYSPQVRPNGLWLYFLKKDFVVLFWFSFGLCPLPVPGSSSQRQFGHCDVFLKRTHEECSSVQRCAWPLDSHI